MKLLGSQEVENRKQDQTSKSVRQILPGQAPASKGSIASQTAPPAGGHVHSNYSSLVWRAPFDWIGLSFGFS